MTPIGPDRIVILSDFATIQGGASKLALLNAELIASRGVPVTFISGDEGADAPTELDMVALGGLRLLEQARPMAALSGLWNTRVRSYVRDWIEQNDTPNTIYHVHGYHQTLSPSSLAPLSKVKRRTVMHAHDYFLACPNGAFFDFRLGKTCNLSALSPACLMRNCDKRSYAHKIWRVARQVLQNRARENLLPNVTTILVHSGMERLLFSGGSGGQLRILPNPAEPFLNIPIRAEENQDIVFIGDIHVYKGVFLLAEAGRRAGISIRFAGDGQDRSRLEQEYPEHRYEGWQSRADLSRIMEKARLLIAPSLGPEPFGLAPVEALLSGIPVAISDSMLLSEDVDGLGVGAKFKAADCADLTEHLAKLSADDKLVAKMSRSAREAGRTISMSQESWGAALFDIYAEVLRVN